MYQESYLIYPIFINEIEIFLPIAKLLVKVNGKKRGAVPFKSTPSFDRISESTQAWKVIPEEIEKWGHFPHRERPHIFDQNPGVIVN